MTDAASLDPTLPISFAVGSLYVSQRQHIAANPQGAHIDALAANINTCYATLEATIAALRSLEAELRDLKAARS